MEEITFVYEGKLADGTVIDDGRMTPLTIEVGRGRVMPALERELRTMDIGEERTITLPADAAYGQRDPRAVRTARFCDIPNASELRVGEYIAWHNPVSSKPIPARVVSAGGGIVELDLNHPLAGCDLTYWVRVEGKRACHEQRA